MRHITLLAALAAAATTLACDSGGGGGGSAPVQVGQGRVSGRLQPFAPGRASGPGRGAPPAEAVALAEAMFREAAATRQALRVAGPGVQAVAEGVRPSGGAPPPVLPDARWDFTPGRLVLTVPPELTVEDVPGWAEGLAQHAPGHALTVDVWAGPRVVALRATADGEPLDHAQTVALAEALLDAEVAPTVELDHYRYAFARPDDPEYRLQWHYAQIGMEAAWDLTTGSADVVCAVIDDGVNPHPELQGRLLPGRDMISELDIAGDGDRRDDTPSQVANCCGGQSVWHGLHVAGTIAAKADGGGVVGVDWACRVLPVRVLGRQLPQGGQGTTVDIVAGIYWAAGYEIPDEPRNANPAAVINLSLGGGSPVQVEQDAVNAAVQAGAVVVAASGNSDEDAGGGSFGAYDNVILVGATDYSGGRASYSNFGATVDVMAPGGAVSLDANADGQPDGVLSTFLDGSGRQAGLYYLEGTSMAAPHVSGLVALMKALRPSLTHAEAEQILKETADPGAQCRQGCGAGLVNAPAALRRVGAGGGGAAPRLSVSAQRLNLGGAQQGQVRVFNAGGGTLSWSAQLTGAAARSLTVGPTQGSLQAGASTTLTVTPDRGGLSDGSHQATLVVSSDGGEARLAVQFTVGAAAGPDVGQVQVATLRPLAGDQVEIGGQQVVGAATGYAFDFPSPGGQWLVVAAADRNGNQVLDDGDLLGFWRSATDIQGVVVGADGLSGLNFAVVPVTGQGVSEAPCAALRRCWEGCAWEQTCMNRCAVSGACQGCFDQRVGPCLQRTGCPGGDCTCQQCGGEVDACFGPATCAAFGGGGGGGGGAGVGAGCRGGDCAAPYQCDTSLPGGYCTADCTGDFDCPGGACVAFDPDQDGIVDFALCAATCRVASDCPRGGDACQPLDTGVGVCLPPG